MPVRRFAWEVLVVRFVALFFIVVMAGLAAAIVYDSQVLDRARAAHVYCFANGCRAVLEDGRRVTVRGVAIDGDELCLLNASRWRVCE